MLAPSLVQRITSYWRKHLGLLEGVRLFERPFRITNHGGELEGYEGVFALFGEGGATLSLPPGRSSEVERYVADEAQGAAEYANSLHDVAGVRVIGPALVSYAESVPAPTHDVRHLDSGDSGMLARLRESCDELEWEHGGISEHTLAMCGVVVAGDELAALASYEVWGATLAHISIITHPIHRGLGYGRSAVAGMAKHALAHGLIPQYRTLVSNAASCKIAESLGFEPYATSVAVRLGENPAT